MGYRLYYVTLDYSDVAIMIELMLTVDEEFTQDHLKCVLAYQDFALAIYDLRRAVKDLWEGEATEESIEEFVARFNEIVNGLPTLP